MCYNLPQPGVGCNMLDDLIYAIFCLFSKQYKIEKLEVIVPNYVR